MHSDAVLDVFYLPPRLLVTDYGLKCQSRLIGSLTSAIGLTKENVQAPSMGGLRDWS